MPLRRCRNFDENGSRKTWPNGADMHCRPNCQFIHPSDPNWDRASSAPVRGRGGPPRGGRGRGQSSFGPSASGANATALGQEWGSSSSSGAWGDYMTSFDHNPRATFGGKGAPSHRSNQTRPETSGWGSSGTDGPGWGSSANNDGGPSNGWSNEASAPGKQASSHQAVEWESAGNGIVSSGDGWGSPGDGWGTSGNALKSSGNAWGSSSEWGTSGDTWGSAGNNPGPSGGETSMSGQGGKASSAIAVTKTADPDVLMKETGANGNPDGVTMTTPLSPAIPASGQRDPTHKEERGEDAFGPTISSASQSIKTRPPHGDHDNNFISALSDVDNMGIAIAVTLKMRELDAELSQLLALRKSRQVVSTRAAKELLQRKVHGFTDTRGTTEAEHDFYSGKLAQPSFLCRSDVQNTLATLGQDNKQLEKFEDWVERADTYLSQVQPQSRPCSPIERSNDTIFVSKLDQLKRRSESLAETIWQCQSQHFYNTLDNQTQDKMDPIVATIVNNLDMSYNHLVSTSLIPLQKQGELWNQTFQIQAERFAQALLQSDQIKRDKKNQSISKQKEKGAIQQIEADIIQKKSQLQVLQEEMAQLHNILTSMEQQQQSHIVLDTLDEYASYIQEYIQRYIQANATLFIKAELSQAMVQFTAAELKTVQKVWKTLQPFIQMSIWLQHLDIHKSEEEMEIREIEESLLA